MQVTFPYEELKKIKRKHAQDTLYEPDLKDITRNFASDMVNKKAYQKLPIDKKYAHVFSKMD